MTIQTTVSVGQKGKMEYWELEHDAEINGEDLSLAIFSGQVYLDMASGTARTRLYPWQPKEQHPIVAKIVRHWIEGEPAVTNDNL
jgi:hypothetical protein